MNFGCTQVFKALQWGDVRHRVPVLRILFTDLCWVLTRKLEDLVGTGQAVQVWKRGVAVLQEKHKAHLYSSVLRNKVLNC